MSTSVAQAMTIDEAVACAYVQNRDILAAKLAVEMSRLDVVAAGLWDNPELSYSVSNIVLGQGNDQERDLKPKAFSQLIHNVVLEQVVDGFGKHRAHAKAADAASQRSDSELEDVLRAVAFATRQAFVDAKNAEDLLHLFEEQATHWQKTYALTQRRLAVGDIARLELDKLDLEIVGAEQERLEAQKQWRLARHHLAVLMGYATMEALPDALEPMPLAPIKLMQFDTSSLLAQARETRPDVRALRQGVLVAERKMVAERRDRWPDVKIGVTYARSHFQISGDNPHALGMSVGVPLPLIHRNHVEVQRANLNLKEARVAVAVAETKLNQELSDALAAWEQARTTCQLLTTHQAISRASHARDASLRAFDAGAKSLLEVLEAERTLVAVRRDALGSAYALRTAAIAMTYVAGIHLPTAG